MSVLDFNGGGSGNSWNYHSPDKDGYSLVLDGQVVGIDTPIAHSFSQDGKQGAPKFWDDGNPVRNIKLSIADANGNCFDWTFSISKKRPTSAFNQVMQAILAVKPDATSIAECMGRHITVTTQQPPQGFGYSASNPRPWSVSIGDEMPRVDGFGYEVTDSAASMQRNQQQVQQEYQQQQAAMRPAPTMQAPQQQAAPQPVMQQPVMQQPMMPQQQAVITPQQQAAVMQQQFPGATVQYAAQAPASQAAQGAQVPVEVYDEDIPF